MVSELSTEMASLVMNVSGKCYMEYTCHCCMATFIMAFASDGEFDYSCAKGYTRPLSVLQMKCMVHNKHSEMSVCRMFAMITPKREFYCSWKIASSIVASIEQLPDGMITTEDNGQIVPQHAVHDINGWMRQNIEMKDTMKQLLPRILPSGYEYHT